jgi:predicted transcriptional regulator
MEKIYPISALQKDAGAVRRDAQEDLIRLTVDGRGMYVFATEEVFENYVQRKIEEALLDQRIAETIKRGDEAISRGEVYTPEEAWDMIHARKDDRAAS